MLYRDTGSAEPGSGPIFGSVSGSENQFLGITYAKDMYFLLLQIKILFVDR